MFFRFRKEIEKENKMQILLVKFLIYISVVISSVFGLAIMKRSGMCEEWGREEYGWFWGLILMWPISFFLIGVVFLCFLCTLPFLLIVWIMAFVPCFLINFFKNN